MRIGELSQRVGVSSDRLRAWERRYGVLRPHRTVGGTRLYSSADETRVRLMQRYLAEGMKAAEAAELVATARLSVGPGSATAIDAPDVQRAHAEMRAALDGFDETTAQRVLEGLFATCAPVAVIREVVLPYLRDVGERWAGGRLTVAQEHFASNFFHARLLALARGWDRGLGPQALLACAPGEQHTFGLIAFGIALHQLGWRITYLGADTPLGALEGAAEHLEPDLLVVAGQRPAALAPHLDGLAALTGRWRCALAGAGATRRLAAPIGADCLVGDPVDAARAVCVVPPAGAAPVLAGARPVAAAAG
jgi:DNA-binding transcriptional MerR regulator